MENYINNITFRIFYVIIQIFVILPSIMIIFHMSLQNIARCDGINIPRYAHAASISWLIGWRSCEQRFRVRVSYKSDVLVTNWLTSLKGRSSESYEFVRDCTAIVSSSTGIVWISWCVNCYVYFCCEHPYNIFIEIIVLVQFA